MERFVRMRGLKPHAASHHPHAARTRAVLRCGDSSASRAAFNPAKRQRLEGFVRHKAASIFGLLALDEKMDFVGMILAICCRPSVDPD